LINFESLEEMEAEVKILLYVSRPLSILLPFLSIVWSLGLTVKPSDTNDKQTTSRQHTHTVIRHQLLQPLLMMMMIIVNPPITITFFIVIGIR